MNIGLSRVIDNLESVLESESLLADDRELEYIDLRFGNRVYYRYLDQRPVEVDTSATTTATSSSAVSQ
jgi:hypothetical protein